MAILKTKGIIISENFVNDYDKMLVMLTPTLGKISCSAKGARKNKSTLLASTQFLCFGEYILYKNPTSDVYNMNSCDIIEVFYNIRIDLEKLKIVSEITKIIQKVTTENEDNYKILQLYLNTLYVISEKEKNMDLVIATFKIRLLAILGYAPCIIKCTECGESENLNFFSFKSNGFKCSNCAKQDKGGISILEVTKNAIQYSVLSEPKKLYSFEIPLEAIKEFKLVADIYFRTIGDGLFSIENPKKINP